MSISHGARLIDDAATSPSYREVILDYKVCYADTDAGGVVYHARYIEMVERARNKLMQLAGFSFASLSKEHDTQLVVHKIEAVYHASAFLEDELQLKTSLSVCRAARTVWQTEVMRDDVALASISIEMVALHVSNRRLRMHPDCLVLQLAKFVMPPSGVVIEDYPIV